jgi:hypothetical protein
MRTWYLVWTAMSGSSVVGVSPSVALARSHQILAELS